MGTSCPYGEELLLRSAGLGLGGPLNSGLILASESQQLAVECRASAFLGWWYRQWQQLEGRRPSSLLATGAPSGNYALARNLSMTQHLLPARSCVGHRVHNPLLRELTSSPGTRARPE